MTEALGSFRVRSYCSVWCAHAGIWQYGGVPAFTGSTVPYIGLGDNIFLDVRSPVIDFCTTPSLYHAAGVQA